MLTVRSSGLRPLVVIEPINDLRACSDSSSSDIVPFRYFMQMGEAMRLVLSMALVCMLTAVGSTARAEGNWTGFYTGITGGGGIASLPIRDLDGWDNGQFGSNLKASGW